MKWKTTSMQNKVIGIFGGTFDPVHLGHLHVALSVCNTLKLSEVRLIPSAQPLLRDAPSATAEQRLAMVKLAIAPHERLIADDREIRRGGSSYMVDTLTEIRAEVGENVPLCCMLSADQFSQFEQWKDWQHILDLAHLVVTTRAGYKFSYSRAVKKLVKQHQCKDFQLLHQSSAGLILFQSLIPLQISGTQIRALIQQGRYDEAKTFLPPLVWEYIQETKLYR